MQRFILRNPCDKGSITLSGVGVQPCLGEASEKQLLERNLIAWKDVLNDITLRIDLSV